MKSPAFLVASGLLLGLCSSLAHAQTAEPLPVQSPLFAIERFEVLGNRILPSTDRAAALTP